MKKNILNYSAAAFLALASVFTGCKKDDITPPVVTLNGAASQTISLNSSYSDPGATANDEKDGVLTPTVSGSVDKDLAGTYTLTYTATDAAGNVGTATRTVIVKNDAEAWAGKYNGQETDDNGLYVYSGNTNASKTVTITFSTIKNNRLSMTRLGDYANCVAYFDVTGTAIDLPGQDATDIGTAGADPDSVVFRLLDIKCFKSHTNSLGILAVA